MTAQSGVDGRPAGWTGRADAKRLNLALQGGGAHGAFTWGVLDRILSDGRIEIGAISGTSAGAINAVVMTDGLMKGGPDRARESLKVFWHRVSDYALATPFSGTPFDLLLSSWSGDSSPLSTWLDIFTRVASPYDFNPLNLNPLRDLVEGEVDFARLRTCGFLDLFISATNVHTGRVRVFATGEITVDAVLASACLPHAFQAVEIDGVPYWDGGYMGNPVLFPFFDCCASSDVLIVQVNPIERATTPRTSRQIVERLNEISFNAPLIRELRHVEFINQCLRRGDLKGSRYREVFLHRIAGGHALDAYGASTKLNAQWHFLKTLRDLGRNAAEAWLAGSFDKIGHQSTLDLSEMAPPHPTRSNPGAS
ncbi:MAG: patatin-like phospholipase family protein [Hyphomicrobiaceae bacterium]